MFQGCLNRSNWHQMHGYNLAFDPEDGSRLYMGADDGVGSTQVERIWKATIMAIFVTLPAHSLDYNNYWFWGRHQPHSADWTIYVIIMIISYHSGGPTLSPWYHWPSQRLFKPEIETSAASNSVGGPLGHRPILSVKLPLQGLFTIDTMIWLPMSFCIVVLSKQMLWGQVTINH